MDLLTCGLLFFFVVHCIPFVPPLRNALYGKLGEKAWKGVFSLLSLAALVVTGFGYYQAETVMVLEPPAWARDFAVYSVGAAFVLIMAANFKSYLRKIFRHPMALGFVLWGVSHVYANGDLASLKMFGGFAVYSIVSVISAEFRGKVQPFKASLGGDIRAILNGAAFYAILFFTHGWLFGAPLY